MIIVIALCLSGCTIAVNDGAPTNDNTIKFEGAGESCLDHSLPAIQNFFVGEGSEPEISAAFTCLSDALKTFETHVHGDERGLYSARELRNFLQKYFLKEQPITDSLLTESMRIKQAILGGNLEYLTHDELKQMHVVLDTFRKEAVKMVPHMKVIGLGVEKPKTDNEKYAIERAIAQATASARVLGSLLGRSQNSYHLSDAATFLREFGKLYSKDKTWEGPDRLIKQLPFVAVMKSFFLRPTGNAIAPDEWQELITKAARLYGLYARSFYLFPNDLVVGEGLRQLTIFTTELFSILDESVQAKENKIIEYRQVNDLVDYIYRLENLKIPVSRGVAKDLLKMIFDRFCNPAVDGNRPTTYGITDDTLVWMKRDFYGWSEIQSSWDSMHGGEGMKISDVRDRWKDFKPTNKEAGDDITNLLGRQHPLAYSNIGTVIFDRPIDNVVMTRGSWNTLNWRRLAMRLLIRGFTPDYHGDVTRGLRKSEYDNAFAEIKPVLVEIGLLKPEDDSLKNSLFNEANLFMFDADSNDEISFYEATEIMSFIFSGTSIANPVIKDTKLKCKHLGHNADGDPVLDVSCFVGLLESNHQKYFAALPQWVEQMKKVKAAGKWGEFTDFLLTAIRDDATTAPIQTGQITKSAVILQYLEALFVRFDLDNSGTLNVQESLAAFPLFKQVLADKSHKTDENELKAIFTFILRYGEAPDKNAGTIIRYLLWKMNKSGWQFEADRYQLLKVVANL